MALPRVVSIPQWARVYGQRIAILELLARLGGRRPKPSRRMPGEDFRSKLDARFKYWFLPSRSRNLAFVAGLVNKTAMYPYVKSKRLELPRRHADVASLDFVDFSALPDRVVVKPSSASMSAGVMLFSSNVELLSGDRVPVSSRASYARDKLAAAQDYCVNGESRIIIEELVEDYDLAYAIPRDFKVYVAGGRARLIEVIDRNGPKDTWSHSFYSRDWDFIDQEVQTAYKRGPRLEPPEKLAALVAAADSLAKDLRCFYRLDFYMARRGPVFGEFTSYPFGGKGFTAFGDRLMCNMMDEYPDAV